MHGKPNVQIIFGPLVGWLLTSKDIVDEQPKVYSAALRNLLDNIFRHGLKPEQANNTVTRSFKQRS